MIFLAVAEAVAVGRKSSAFLAVAEAVAEGRKTLLEAVNHNFENKAGNVLEIWETHIHSNKFQQSCIAFLH